MKLRHSRGNTITILGTYIAYHVINYWIFLYPKLMSAQVLLVHTFPGMVNFGLGHFVLSFAGIRNWAEIYRYVMILARFEVGINMAMCYLTRKYF